MEEITDNRPRQVDYVNDFAENGIASLRVNEAVADKFTTAYLNVKILKTNRETMEETTEETISIDISCILYPRNDVMFEWKFDKLKTPEIHYLTIKVESDVPLLSDFLAKKLNPL
jgi:hypothetical protein